MRLLHQPVRDGSRRLEFVEFNDEEIGSYAILSHTWGKTEDEVSYQDMRDGLKTSTVGFDKIRRFGEVVASEYFWVDTCCIDKSSSAELSQAINSMFSWYRDASICYAYLSDVPPASSRAQYVDSSSPSFIGRSRWFTRGWTLQELIAPSNLVFVSKSWSVIGTKKDLSSHLNIITGIHIEALDGSRTLEDFSISERMSWASGRKTSRPEDLAYSLMGIFNVNMPLLYGEKGKSFIRLQEEIMKTSNDQSLFAWIDPDARADEPRGLLAQSPSQFEKNQQISSLGLWGKGEDFSVTNRGLRVRFYLIPYVEDIFRASLDCSVGNSFDLTPGIYLKRISGSRETWAKGSEAEFARVRCGHLDQLKAVDKTNGSYRTVLIRQDQTSSRQTFRGRRLFSISNDMKSIRHVFPARQWNPQTELFVAEKSIGKAGAVLFDHREMELRYMIIFGINNMGRPWHYLVPKPSTNPYRDYISFKDVDKIIEQETTALDGADIGVRFLEDKIHGLEVLHLQVSLSNHLKNSQKFTKDYLEASRIFGPMRDPFFAGRKLELEAIHNELSLTGSICVIGGAKGMGKTSIALEYLYRFSSAYNFAFWITSKTRTSTAHSYGDIAAHFVLNEQLMESLSTNRHENSHTARVSLDRDLDGLRTLGREFLEHTEKRWLLIFDNVSDWENIADYVPRKFPDTHGSILITADLLELNSIPQHLASFLQPDITFTSMLVTSLDLNECTQILVAAIEPDVTRENLLSHTEYSRASDISKLLHYHPLAISLAAGFLSASKVSPSEFLQLWAESTEHKIREPLSEIIDNICRVSMRELSVDAAHLLRILAVLDSDSVPTPLLVGNHKEENLQFLHIDRSYRFNRILLDLKTRRLIRLGTADGQAGLSISECIQERILMTSYHGSQIEMPGEAFLLVRKRYPSAWMLPEWYSYQRYGAHVISLSRFWTSNLDNLPRNKVDGLLLLAGLFYDAAVYFLDRQHRNSDCKQLLEAAQMLLDSPEYEEGANRTRGLRAKVFAAMSVDSLRSLGNKGHKSALTLVSQYRQIAIDLYESNPTDINFEVANENARVRHAYLLMHMRNYEIAETLLGVTALRLRSWTKSRGRPRTQPRGFPWSKDIPRPKDFLSWQFDELRATNLAINGNFDEALDVLRESAQAIEVAFGRKARWLSCRFLFACFLLQEGGERNALAMHEEILEFRELEYGKSYQQTVESYYAVGATYHTLGEHDQAIEHIEEAIRGAESTFRRDEWFLARAKFHLALLLNETGLRSAEIPELEKDAEALLKTVTDVPAFLVGKDDELSLLDHMQALETRFTNQDLLKHMVASNIPSGDEE